MNCPSGGREEHKGVLRRVRDAVVLLHRREGVLLWGRDAAVLLCEREGAILQVHKGAL